jgi:hypothetical protein
MTRTKLFATCSLAAVLALGAAGTANARSSYYFGINTAPAYAYPAPVYVAPVPPPPPPVYYYPRYYAPAPYYAAPVGVGFSFGYRSGGHHR